MRVGNEGWQLGQKKQWKEMAREGKGRTGQKGKTGWSRVGRGKEGWSREGQSTTGKDRARRVGKGRAGQKREGKEKEGKGWAARRCVCVSAKVIRISCG